MRRLLVIGGVLAALGCMWDHDTLRQERARFPDALELITGKFLRHSKDFYRWRIADREARLEVAPNDPALLDDLAVAYAKTGDTDRAIATMKRASQDRYETHANLGTFDIMAGNLDGALAEIDRALAINPDAHFGRERYQRWLVEYLRTPERRSFFEFAMAHASAVTREARSAELPKAVTGILGMMRFADYSDPVLLGALGDLLMDGGAYTLDDAKQLAARAYLRAGGATATAPADANGRLRARRALEYQTIEGTEDQVPLEQVEAELSSELAEADAWYATLHARELDWIEHGQNPEAEFDKLYASEPAVVATMNAHDAQIPRWKWLIYGSLLGASIIVIVLLARRFRR